MKTLLITTALAVIFLATPTKAATPECQVGEGFYKCCPIISYDPVMNRYVTNCVPGHGGGGISNVGVTLNPNFKHCEYETKRS